MNTEGKKRQLWTAKKKAQVVLEGLQGKLSAAELCRKYGITPMMIFPNLISLWLLSGVVSDMVKKYRIKDQVPVRGIFRRK
jgi:hypothetical protein